MGTVPPPLVTLNDLGSKLEGPVWPLWITAHHLDLLGLFLHLQSGNDATCLASWVFLDRENMLQVTKVPGRL